MGTMLRMSPVLASQEFCIRSKNGGDLWSSGGRGVTGGFAKRGQFCKCNSPFNRCSCLLALREVGMSGQMSLRTSGSVEGIDRRSLVVSGYKGTGKRWPGHNAQPLVGVRKMERITVRAAGDDNESKSGTVMLPEKEEPKATIESQESESDTQASGISSWLYPSKEELPDDKEMTIFDHLEELRDRLLVSVGAVGVAIMGCFFFAKDLIVLLEAPVYAQGVRFLQLSPGEYFFTTLKVSGYCGLLIGSPVILYEIIAFVLPGLTRSEKKFLGPIVISSSVLFFTGIGFSYKVLTPAALTFFVNYAEGAVESLWSIDQYFEFVLVLLFSTGISFQVPVIQLLLGQTRIVSADQMLSAWRYVVVGAVVAAAILTPSTDPLTQILLAGPLIGLYLGGAFLVKFLVSGPDPDPDSSM